MNSQNGWSVIENKQLDKSDFPGLSIKPAPGVRAGDVAVVLLWLGSQFNARVEALVNGWNWGYANRNVIGGSDVSNHASGTAIDLNAPRHPLGKAGTYTPTQVAKIREILVELEGVVRWGGDYAGRKDEMHFEIVGSETAVAAVANKLRGGSEGGAPAPEPSIDPAKHMETVTTPTLWNVRKSADPKSPAIGTVGVGETYETLIVDNNWRYVYAKGGYVTNQAFSGTATPPVAPKQHDYVQLPPTTDDWAAYPENGPYSRSAKKFVSLNPKKFKGLEYRVVRYVANGAAAVIDTADYGRRAVWIKDTPAKIIKR